MPDFHKIRVFKRVTKIMFTIFIALVAALFLWRVFFSTAMPDSIKPLLPNQALSEAYFANGEKLTLRYQNNYSTTYEKGRAGYFSNSEAIFIPEANQLQVVVRYTSRTLDYLARDYGIDPAPDKALDWFEFSLVKSTDLTPNDPDDYKDASTFSHERYYPSRVTRDESSTYVFYRLVFENVTIESDTDGIFLDAYYLQDVNYEKPSYGTLCLYDCRMNWEYRDLTSADKQAITSFKQS